MLQLLEPIWLVAMSGIVAPVLDPEHREILGVVTVDDVLELLLPTGWRRDFGRTAVED